MRISSKPEGAERHDVTYKDNEKLSKAGTFQLCIEDESHRWTIKDCLDE
jgi:hypothetical protein